MNDQTTQGFPDPTTAFDDRARQLERRRALARSLIEKGMTDTGQMVGPHYVVNPWSNFINAAAGSYMEHSAARDATTLEQEQSQAAQALIKRLATPGTVEQTYDPATNPGTGPLINGTVPMTPEEESSRRLGVIGEGMAIPSLRQTLQAQLGQELDYPRQREQEAKRLAAETARLEAQDKRQAALFAQQEKLLDARLQGQERLKQMPTIHISNSGGGQGKAPSGFRWTADGNLEPIPGGPGDKSGKPLTAKQQETQRGFMDLDTSLNNYEQLLDAYDFQGKTAIDPAKRAALEGAYTDVQMKLKTLYELGAPQAGDLKLLTQSIPNPVDLQGTLRGAAFGASPFKAKLGETRKLLNASRTNFETQFGKPTPEAAKPQAERKTLNGKTYEKRGNDWYEVKQ